MRVYKIGNEYLDLDHVLAVSDLMFKDYTIEGEEYDSYFYVTLAFQDKQKRYGFFFPWDEDFDPEVEKEKMRCVHADFIGIWQNKPSIVIPDPLPTIQVRTGKPR